MTDSSTPSRGRAETAAQQYLWLADVARGACSDVGLAYDIFFIQTSYESEVGRQAIFELTPGEKKKSRTLPNAEAVPTTTKSAATTSATARRRRLPGRLFGARIVGPCWRSAAARSCRFRSLTGLLMRLLRFEVGLAVQPGHDSRACG